MSETLISQVTVASGTVAQQRKQYGQEIRSAIRDEKRAAIRAGQYLTLAKSTFTADELEQWKTWSVEVTGKSLKTVESYLAVAKAYSGSTAAQQKKVAGWTFESLQAYASVPEDDRRAVLAAVPDSQPTPEQVRQTRDEVKLAKLSPAEQKEKAAAKKTREREQAAEKTTAASDALKAFIGRRKLDSMTPEQLVQLGVMVALAHGQYAESGVQQFFQQREQALAKLAKRDEQVAAAAVAAK